VKKPFNKFITNENKHLCSNEALDFLSKMLIYDHVYLVYIKLIYKKNIYIFLSNNRLKESPLKTPCHILISNQLSKLNNKTLNNKPNKRIKNNNNNNNNNKNESEIY
jgi:hypothetical protein